MATGTLFLTLRYPCAFEVQVMPSHMLAHCPGVVSLQNLFTLL